MKKAVVLLAASLVASSSRPVEATIEEVDGCEHASDCVDHYWRMIWVLIALASFIYFVLLAWTCWISNRVRKKYCYLCEDLVSKHDWVNGRHRRECQKHRMHKEFLARLPVPYASIMCPDCSEPLKLWPMNRGSLYFACDGDNCIYDGYELRNSGDTRYNCFLHDFNLCKACVEKSLRWSHNATNDRCSKSSVLNPNFAQDIDSKATVTSEIPKRPIRKSADPLKLKVVKKNKEAAVHQLMLQESKQTADNHNTAPRRTSADYDVTKSADFVSKSAETLTDEKTEEEARAGISAETLVDGGSKAATEDAFNKDDITTEEPPKADQDKNKKNKWNRSRSYAHAVDT